MIKKIIYQITILLVLILFSSPLLSQEEITNLRYKEFTATEIEVLRDTCLDEYAQRNAFVKKFITWAPPTLILSIPALSQTYLIAMIGWSILPIEYLNAAIISAALAGPTIIGIVVTLETKYAIEYFGNRFIVKVVDALRMGDDKNKSLEKLLNKFRKNYPESSLTDKNIFNKILELDKNGSLCNGDLTGSKSEKLKKLIARRKHIFRYLGQFE